MILKRLNNKDVIFVQSPENSFLEENEIFIDSNSELSKKIEKYHYNVKIIYSEKGEIIDIQPSKAEQIKELKQKLFDTDYQALKYVEGQISEEEYAEMKAQRQAWRNEINELEAEMGLDNG